MAPVLAAKVYRPPSRVDGRSLAALDEDAFTLAATALEAILPALPPGDSAVTLVLVGAATGSRDDLWSAVVGRPLTCERPGGSPSELLRLLETPRPSATLLVGAEYANGGAPAPGPGDGAFAYLLPTSAVSSETQPGTHDRPVPATWVDAAMRMVRSDPRSASTRGAGDGTALSENGGGSPRARAEPLRAALGAVSEGAYVPRARYLEGLGSRWRFEADRCGRCGTVTFPARGLCRGCEERTGLTRVRLPLDGGTVVSITEIGRGGQPTEFDPWVDAVGSYAVALVELAPGVRATLQVTDAPPGQLRIGDRVGTRLRRLYPMEGEWRYGRKAVPLASSG